MSAQAAFGDQKFISGHAATPPVGKVPDGEDSRSSEEKRAELAKSILDLSRVATYSPSIPSPISSPISSSIAHTQDINTIDRKYPIHASVASDVKHFLDLLRTSHRLPPPLPRSQSPPLPRSQSPPPLPRSPVPNAPPTLPIQSCVVWRQLTSLETDIKNVYIQQAVSEEIRDALNRHAHDRKSAERKHNRLLLTCDQVMRECIGDVDEAQLVLHNMLVQFQTSDEYVKCIQNMANASSLLAHGIALFGKSDQAMYLLKQSVDELNTLKNTFWSSQAYVNAQAAVTQAELVVTARRQYHIGILAVSERKLESVTAQYNLTQSGFTLLQSKFAAIPQQLNDLKKRKNDLVASLPQ